MKSIQRWLVLLIFAELLAGGVLITRRLLRMAPPVFNAALVDPVTANEIRSAAAACETDKDWRNLGELFMAAGFFAESEMCHRVACDLAPRNATFRHQWAFAIERLGLLDEANAQFQRTMELSNSVADNCRYFIGRNQLRLGNADAAKQFFTDGRALSANVYELARLHLRDGDIATASKLHAELVARDSDLLQVNLLGYRLALQRGNTKRAFEFADKVRYSPRKLWNPFDDDAQRIVEATQQLGPGRIWQEARELLEGDRLAEAQNLLDQAAVQDRSAQVLELLAEVAVQQLRFDAAIQLYEELQLRYGPFARTIARMGDVHAAAGRLDQARECWLKAARLQTGVDLKAIHHKLADSFSRGGDEENAARQRALGHYYVGRDLLYFGYAAQSVNYFRAASESDPTLTQAWFYLGESQRLSGQAVAARMAYQECLKRNPHHGRALASLQR